MKKLSGQRNRLAKSIESDPIDFQLQLDDLRAKLNQAKNFLNGDMCVANPFYPYYPASQRQNVVGWTIDTTQSKALFDNVVPEYESSVNEWNEWGRSPINFMKRESGKRMGLRPQAVGRKKTVGGLSGEQVSLQFEEGTK